MYTMRRPTQNDYVWFITMFIMFSGSPSQLARAQAKEVQKPLSVEQAVRLAAFESSVDPELMLAIAHVESSMNPKAVGKLGEVGLFQLRKEYFPKATFKPLDNARIAARHLAWLKERPACRARGKAWFVCHNTGANKIKMLANPMQTLYYKRVAAQYERAMAFKTANADE